MLIYFICWLLKKQTQWMKIGLYLFPCINSAIDSHGEITQSENLGRFMHRHFLKK